MNLFFALLDEAAAPADPGFMGKYGIIIIYAVIILALWLLMIRPQRKRQKEQEAMQNALQPGDWVLLSNGMYGKVVNLINECCVVELGTNKSIMIPVLKSQIQAASEPDLTPHVANEADIAPTNEIVANDVAPESKDGLDDYERMLIEKNSKKKAKFGRNKDGEI